MFSNYRAIGFVAASAGALLLAFLCARPALTDDEKGDDKRGDQRGDAIFDRVDNDGNGSISREEFEGAAARLKHAMKRMRHERERHARPKHSGESHRPVPHRDGDRKARKPEKHKSRTKWARGPHGRPGTQTIVHVHHHYYHPGGPPPHHAGSPRSRPWSTSSLGVPPTEGAAHCPATPCPAPAGMPLQVPIVPRGPVRW